MTNFVMSLRVMGLGMLGIFSVTLVMTGMMKLITMAVPGKGDGEEE